MKTGEVQRLVDGYLSVRLKNRSLTAPEAAGFLITQFGALEAVARIEDKGIHKASQYWNDVHKTLRTTISGD